MKVQVEREVDERAEFVEHFAEGWRIGASDPERFYRHFAPRCTADVLFVQPIARAPRGPGALRGLFAPVFAAMPDLRGEVLRWGGTRDGVMIEVELRGTFAGRPVRWVSIDRIVLRDGLIAERTANFDPLPLMAAMLRRPLALARLLPRLIRRENP